MKALNAIYRYVFGVFVLFVPLVFLPFNFYSAELAKAWLAYSAVAILFILWGTEFVLSGMQIGRFSVRKTDWFVGLFAIWALLSSWISKDAGSFVGGNLVASGSFFVAIGALLYFLSRRMWNRPSGVLLTLAAIFWGAVVSAAVAVVHLIKPFSLGAAFSTSSAFNLTGDTYALGLYILVALFVGFLLISRSRTNKGWLSAYIIGVVIMLAALILLNILWVWIMLGLGSAIVIAYLINSQTERHVLALSIAALALSFIFILVPFNWKISPQNPVTLPYSYNWQAVRGSIGQNFFFGSGPDSWSVQMLRFEPKEVNENQYFYAALSGPPEFLRIFAEEGYGGLLFYLGIISAVVIAGIRAVRRSFGAQGSLLRIAVVAWLIVTLFSFVYPLSVSGWLLFWILSSLVVSGSLALLEAREETEIIIEETAIQYEQ